MAGLAPRCLLLFRKWTMQAAFHARCGPANGAMQCGSGVAVSEGVLEIRGAHVERVMPALRERGFTVKRTGS